MRIGLGQILVIVILLVLLFGNGPKIIRDISTGIGKFKDSLKEDSKANES